MGQGIPVGYSHLPTEEVLNRFLRDYPKHQECRVQLHEKLSASTHNMENGKVRVPKASPLGSTLTI